MSGVFEDEDLCEDELLELTDAAQQAELRHRLAQGTVQSATEQPKAAQAAEQPRQVPFLEAERLLEDIEDVGHTVDRKAQHRRRGLFVTDFSASEWCQQRTAFALSAKLPEELVRTPAMQTGTEQHALLEAETALDQIEVQPETREDAFAVRLLNMAQGLRQLLREGRTRELPVCGTIQGCWVRGIVDQLDLEPEGVTVVEQKTRFQPSLPSRAQKRTTALQVMLYRHLVGQLQHTFGPAAVIGTLKAQGLDPSHTLSRSLLDTLPGLRSDASLASAAALLGEAAASLPGCNDTMRVNYIWQGDGELLEQESVVFDPAELDSAAERHLKFWRGDAGPERVSESESWKCNHCVFRRKCWPDRTRTVPWQH